MRLVSKRLEDWSQDTLFQSVTRNRQVVERGLCSWLWLRGAALFPGGPFFQGGPVLLRNLGAAGQGGRNRPFAPCPTQKSLRQSATELANQPARRKLETAIEKGTTSAVGREPIGNRKGNHLTDA